MVDTLKEFDLFVDRKEGIGYVFNVTLQFSMI